MKKLNFIDSLRGLAILAVIMLHTNQYGRPLTPGILKDIVTQGGRGVQLFYLASAFTLFLSFERRSAEKFPVRNFFLRRFFRIAPMYYLGIIYYLFQDGFGPRYWLGDETRITLLNVLSNITFLHGFNPYWITSTVPGGWSIAIEMTFYAILPFLFTRIRNLNHAFIFFILSIFIRLIFHLSLEGAHLIGDSNLWNEYLFLYFPNQLPVFSIGILFYYLWKGNERIKDISGKALLIFSGLCMYQLVTGSQLFPSHVKYSIVLLFVGLALSNHPHKLIVNPLIRYIGKISFSMYLVHFAVLHWLSYFEVIDYFKRGTINYSVRFIIVCVLTVLISSVFYKLVEVPFQLIGKRVIDRMEGAIKKAAIKAA